MVTTSRIELPKKCPRCNKALVYDPDGPYCFLHGTVSPEPIEKPKIKHKPSSAANQDLVPPKPAGKNLLLIHKYYKENREQILKDIQAIGEEATRKKWNMARSSFDRLFRGVYW